MKKTEFAHFQVNIMKCFMCALLLAALPQPGKAQIFNLNILAQFDGTNGSSPSGVIQGDNDVFYGTASEGGSNGVGVIFKLANNNLLTVAADFATNSGANPSATPIFGPDGFLYGTTQNGGTSTGGTIFKCSTNGALSTLASFDFVGGKWINGRNPKSSLTFGPDDLFYGTTLNGGTNDNGAIFSVSTNGSLTGLQNLSSSSGSFPVAGLTKEADGLFYATTTQGGTDNKGAVISYSTNGSLTSLASFNGSNGAAPNAALTLGNNGLFYGTTAQGGAYGKGTVFSLDITNGQITTLFDFDTTNGANPGCELTLGNDGLFYGTTSQGGNTNFNSGQGYGTVFRISTNGSLTKLIEFNGTNGSFPNAELTLANDGTLYGTTTKGGVYDKGTIFRLIPQFPPLNISLFSGEMVLSWTNSAFSLQAAPEVTGIYTNLPGSMSPYTSAISGDRQFFRLIGN